jgi:hypothetical protein
LQFHEVCKTVRLQRPYPKFKQSIIIIRKFKGENTGRGTWSAKDIFPKFVWERICCKKLPSLQCE